MFVLSTVFTYLLLPAPGISYTGFAPNCTIPPENTNIVGSPPVRGTSDILWTCVSVLVTCTWAVQHLSVPQHDHPEVPSWLHGWKEKARHNWKKFTWTLLTIASPEYIFAKGLSEFLAARYSNQQFLEARKGHRHWKQWTTTHAYFANMRGFILQFYVAAVKTKTKPSKTRTIEGDQQQLHKGHHDPPYLEQDVEETIRREREHCQKKCDPDKDHVLDSPTFGDISNVPSPLSPLTPLSPNVQMFWEDSPARRLLVPNPKSAPSIPSQESRLPRHRPWRGKWALNASQMLYACQQGIIRGPPNITAEQLNERSKGDAFVKVAAVMQITWLVIEIITRSIKGLAITLLEVTVLAFAATAISTYFVLITKPQDIRLPEYIEATSLLTRPQIIGLAARSNPSSMAVHEFWLHGVAIRDQADNVFPYSPGIPIPYLTLQRSLVTLKPIAGLPLPIHTPTPQPVYHEEILAGHRFRLPSLTLRWTYLNTTIAGIGIAGTIFGSIHCAAWNFAFPTPVEAMLWRISCLLILIMPPMAAILYATITHEARTVVLEDGREVSQEDSTTNRWLKPLGYAAVPVYFVARVFLVVEVFRSLAYLPSSAYVATAWPGWLPHVV
ncbi:hypothetical protein MMC10_000228 [Thelotrema lepadinum]|nr:hypothetical protein [Thelotrema lepadinum]